MRKLDWILLFVAALLVVFIVCMIVTFWEFQSIPDTLVAGVVGAVIAELFACARIKMTDKHDEHTEVYHDERSDY